MKSIFEMSVMDFMIKSGNINVDAGELKHLLYMIERLQTELNDEVFMNNYLSYVEYFQNKYIVLGDLRNKEKSSFDFMRTIEKSMKILFGEDFQKANVLYKDQCKEYSDYKEQRVSLQKSLETLKNEKYSWII